MMGAVDRQGLGLHDVMEPRPDRNAHLMPGFVAGVRLLMGQRVLHFIGEVLNQRAAQGHGQQLLPAANAEHRAVLLQKAFGQSQFKVRTVGLQHHRVVFGLFPKQRWVHIKSTTRDDQAVNQISILIHQADIRRQYERQAPGCRNRRAIVHAQRIPGKLGIAAGVFPVCRDTDKRLFHAPGFTLSRVAGSSAGHVSEGRAKCCDA